MLAEREPETSPMSSIATLDYTSSLHTLDPASQTLSNPFKGPDDHSVEPQS